MTSIWCVLVTGKIRQDNLGFGVEEEIKLLLLMKDEVCGWVLNGDYDLIEILGKGNLVRDGD